MSWCLKSIRHLARMVILHFFIHAPGPMKASGDLPYTLGRSDQEVLLSSKVTKR
jgi:hypothetical protein